MIAPLLTGLWEKEWSAKDWWTDPADETLERAWQLDMLTMKQGKGDMQERWVSLAETRPRQKQATGAPSSGLSQMASIRLMINPRTIHIKLAFKDCAVEAAVHALTDPSIDIGTWKFASSFAPYVWSLGEIESGARIYYFLELGEPRQNSRGVWL